MATPHRPEISDGDDQGASLSALQQDMETLVHVISHDLRAPIVTIQGFCQELTMVCERLRSLFQEKPLLNEMGEEIQPLIAQDIPEAIHFIQAGADSISTVTSGLVRFIRLGQMDIEWQPLDINTIVGGIVTSMEYQMRQKGVVLHLGDLPPCMGDLVLITQVFSNLIDNALKYLDTRRPGEITIAGKAENGWSIYSITDNGIGIPRQHHKQVFQVFHRVDPKREKGDGLGLAIIQRILERHKAKIQLQSAPGEGSTFSIYLPRVMEDSDDETMDQS
ncbi:MAG: ATP-binding protein [Nitrospirales bacterium]|nr:HAMP domain-containing histidine kinase [Nitrospirales bacterium]